MSGPEILLFLVGVGVILIMHKRIGRKSPARGAPVVAALTRIIDDCADYHQKWADQHYFTDRERSDKQAQRAAKIRAALEAALGGKE